MGRADQMLFSYIVQKNAKHTPDKLFLIDQSRRCTFKEFDERTNSLARGVIARGLKGGDRVAVIHHNAIELLEVYFGVMKAGGIATPINVRLAAREVEEILVDLEPILVVAGKEYLSKIARWQEWGLTGRLFVIGGGKDIFDYESLVDLHPDAHPENDANDDDTAMIIYTSGTTGKPKGVMLTHRNLLADAWASVISRRLTPDGVALVTAPLSQAGALGSMLANLLCGNTIVIMNGFEPARVLATIERERITTALFIPPMILKLLEFPDLDQFDLSSMKTVVYGAAPMPVEALKQAINRFGWEFMGACGATETGPAYISFLDREDHHLDGSPEMELRLHSIGKEGINSEVRIFDEADAELPRGQVGEIVVRGPNIMKGYWRKERETEKALVKGWYHTGDMGYMDEKGYIYIIDRKKDMIISGGFNIYPKEVETVLEEHPAVLEAAVIGVSHPLWGETPVAFVVLRKDSAETSSEELMAFLRERLAGYKMPKGGILFREDLPRNASGKVLKRELRDLYPHWKSSQEGGREKSA